MTARFLASRGESSHRPAWETWIQSGGLRKPRPSIDRSFETLRIRKEAYANCGQTSSRAAAWIQVRAPARIAAAPAMSGDPDACYSPRRRDVDAGPDSIPPDR